MPRKFHKMKDGTERAKITVSDYLTAGEIMKYTRLAKKQKLTLAAYLNSCLRYGLENMHLEFEGDEEEEE